MVSQQHLQLYRDPIFQILDEIQIGLRHLNEQKVCNIIEYTSGALPNISEIYTLDQFVSTRITSHLLPV